MLYQPFEISLLVSLGKVAPVWSVAIFVANTVMVATLQVPVTVLVSRLSRRIVLTLARVLLAASHLGFLAATPLGPHPAPTDLFGLLSDADSCGRPVACDTRRVAG